jgi:hypothetical protein
MLGKGTSNSGNAAAATRNGVLCGNTSSGAGQAMSMEISPVSVFATIGLC